jgi:hypothetical protein
LLLAEIARGFETQVEFSHDLKRVSRFVSNDRLSSLNSEEVVARQGHSVFILATAIAFLQR